VIYLPRPTGSHRGHLPALVAARRPLSAWPRLMHGDLTGNVLFADGLPPLVIDLSLIFRAVTGHLARSEHSLAVRDGYRSAVELALTLAASS